MSIKSKARRFEWKPALSKPANPPSQSVKQQPFGFRRIGQIEADGSDNDDLCWYEEEYGK